MKKFAYLLLAVVMTACIGLMAACADTSLGGEGGGNTPSGTDTENGGGGASVNNLIDGTVFKEACVDEFGHSVVEKTSDGIKFASVDGKGGYCVQWNELFDFNDFSMSFKLSAEKIVNDRKWFGFALSSSNDRWYDTVSNVLIYFRLDYETDGTPKSSATVNVIAQKKMMFPGENPELEVKVPVNLDGENTFTLSYMEIIEDWVMSFNDTDIVVKPSQTTTSDTTANFANVYKEMPNGKAYLHFASDRLKDDGNTSFTLLKVNGTDAVEYLD